MDCCTATVAVRSRHDSHPSAVKKRAHSCTLAFVLALTLSPPLAAQRVHGTLRDSTSSQIVLGAVVSLLDSAGATLARTISDEHGQYALPLGLGRRRLRVIRIGYQPREVAVSRARDDVTLDIAMTRIPAMLSSVKVNGRPLCPGSGDNAGGLAFSLWEQARAALLASVVAREAKPADVRMLSFERTLNMNDGRVRSQKQTRKEGRSTKPFYASAEPSVFAQSGYIKEDPGGRVYYAPDAEVLLHESFATTHCFSLTIDRDHPAQVGIAFEPASGAGRDTLVDVSGVLWLDRDHPELRTLEFKYTGLEPAASSARTGGIISFRTMANGVVFIDWWWLRYPVMVASFRSTVSSPYQQTLFDRRSERRDLRVNELDQSGGELLSASWPDGTTISLEPGRIVGHVMEKGTAKPRAGVIVKLEGTYEETKTDSSGAFVFTPVVPGKYTLAASDTLLSDLVDARTASRSVDVTRGDTVVADLAVSPFAEVVSRVCQGWKAGPETSILVGTVLDSTAAPMRNVAVTARWLEAVNVIDVQAQVHHTERTYQVDDAGRFRFCGVVQERPVALKLLRPDGVAIADTSVFAYDAVVRFNWRVRPKR